MMIAAAPRALLRSLTLWPAVRLLCARRRVIGRGTIPAGPVIFVANHASHADTPLLIRSLPRHHRIRVAPAAAADYFFRTPIVAAMTRAIIGAFPFPRRGTAGLDAAQSMLEHGRSVLLFPEGTRSADGRIQPFKTGVVRLAVRSGAPIVPVGLAGTREILAKNHALPHRRPVAVVFAAPIRVARDEDVHAGIARVEASVRRAAAEAEAARAPHRTLHAAVRTFARSRAALVAVFAWAFAEALVWPIVPDIAVAALVLAAPRRIVPVAAAAIAGSVAGGLAAFVLANPALLDHVPLVTDRMQTESLAQMTERGAAGIWSQPFSGIPYKVYAAHAAGAGIDAPEFVLFSTLARGARLIQVAAVFAAGAFLMRRWLERLYPWTLGATLIVFVYGLQRVVAAWS